MKKTIYLDNAASTPIAKEVKKEVLDMMELYGNPSSFNDFGRLARKKLDESRLQIARFLSARSDEIVFTSSGSESNNMAIFGVADLIKKGEILTTPIEHLSVLEPLDFLKKRGWEITYLKVDREGRVDLDDLKKKLNQNVVLVSIGYANNEIGTIQPIKLISRIIHDFRNQKFEIQNSKFKIHEKALLFHVDACQAANYLDMNVNNLGVDLLTFNGAKIYGPRGAAVLYVKRGVVTKPFVFGGSQENGLRAGTENLSAIAGLAKAVSLINKEEESRVIVFRDYFLEKIVKILPNIKINGPQFLRNNVSGTPGILASGKFRNERLSNNINISIPDITGEQLLLELDKLGIYASSGSACTAHSVEPSHVLKAIGVEKKYLDGALRLSIGRQTTKKDMDYVLKVLPKVVSDLRKIYGK